MLSQVINTGPARANRRLRTLLCLYTFVNCNMPATICMNFGNIHPQKAPHHQSTSLEGMSCSTMPSSISSLLRLHSFASSQKLRKTPRPSPFISANPASVRKPFQVVLSQNPDHIQLLLYRSIHSATKKQVHSSVKRRRNRA